jgi:DNA repair protein RecN (Recombination protein N)
MLLQLSVRNLVLIEKLDLELGAGFNVMTGETGAGKSMIVTALELVTGGRARPDAVRAGAKEAEVTALFDVASGSALEALLAEYDVPHEGELVIRRVVSEARSRAFLNGRLVSAGELRAVAKDLCDISSQHESVSLTDPATHAAYLDAFGGLSGERGKLARAVESLADVDKRIAVLRETARTRVEREDYLRFQLAELRELAPSLGEEQELENERGRLRHSERLATVTQGAYERLYEGESALCDMLGRTASEVESLGEIDGTLAPLGRRLHDARAELADVARELGRYASSVENDPSRLQEVEERMARLSRLLSKHGPTTRELLAFAKATEEQLDALEHGEETMAALEREREGIFAKVAKAARELSRQRRGVADKLADAIGRELALLGMGRAKVIVDVSPIEPSGEAPSVDGARLTQHGLDRVEFLIAPNRGEEPRPLRKIASGGELSRALLALKRVLSDSGPAGFYVFDEVDTGVGGAIAEVIGRAIADVAKHRQVLCITHLPQIAAQGEHHYVVEKGETDNQRTRTQVRKLKPSERVNEIARMLGGIRLTDATRNAAKEMLDAQRRA